MSTDANESGGHHPDAGSSTDQDVTGYEETGTFTTDEAPTGDTPAHGSSNEVFNAAGGNKVGPEEE
ncbi:hypothetical protein [Actinoplanes sp. RD1]|uniref:hypothetical protein n=1 Tax=Actinoplanes sp. RD1 TaxID=3064538 RepID=UPI0027426E5C|nr:hypothetical protein [Actinoplanes sp. RD1]